MRSIQFRRAYACARLNLPLSDDLVDIAAIIALEGRKKRDTINDCFTFLLDLKGGLKDKEKPRKRAKSGYSFPEGTRDILAGLPDEGVYRRETGASLPDIFAD